MGLVRHWKLDDNAASTAVVDAQGVGNGTLEGGDNTQDKQTNTGPGNLVTKALDFNGTDDAILVASLSLTNYSLSAWVKFDTAAGAIVGRTSNPNRYIGKINDTTIRVMTFSTGSAGAVDYTVPSLGTTNWRHIVVTRDGSNNTRVFVDAGESSTGAQNCGTGNMAFLQIGRGNYSSSNNFLDGKIAWVKLFDSDESANVASLFAEGVSTFNAAWASNCNVVIRT